MWKKLRWLIALLAVFALVAAACGDDDDTSSGDDGGVASDDGGEEPSDDGGVASDDGGEEPSDDGGVASDDGGEEPSDDGGVASDDGGEEPSDDGQAVPGLAQAELGMIIPTSGPLAVPASEVIQGAEIAVDVWNDVVDGSTAVMEVCDDAGDPERSLTCIDRFAGEVDVILGPHFGSFWRATEQTFIDRGLFVITGTPAAVPPPDSLAFSAGTPDPPAIEMVFGYLQSEGLTSVGFLSTTDGSATAAAATAADLADEAGIDLARAEFENDAETAVPQVQQIEDTDAIFIWTTGSSAVTALRAIKDVGFDGPVIMNFANTTPSTYELAADVLPDDVRFIGSPAFIGEGIDDPLRLELANAFRAAYEAEYGPIGWPALAGGDIIFVAMAAASNGTTGEEMTAYLESGATVPGLTVSFQYSADAHTGSNDPAALRLVRLVDGVWEFADN